MTANSVVNISAIQQWHKHRLTVQAVEAKLMSMGLDAESVQIHVLEFKKLTNAERQKKGFFLASLGSVLGFLSCLVTMINPVPELCNFFLYGVTSAAILITTLGLYFVFE